MNVITIPDQKNSSFVEILLKILDKEEYKQIITWDQNEKYIKIINKHRLEDEVLKIEYLHKNYSSFVRQLNMYGFKKIKRSSSQIASFHNPIFDKNSDDKLSLIKPYRKKYLFKQWKQDIHTTFRYQSQKQTFKNTQNPQVFIKQNKSIIKNEQLVSNSTKLLQQKLSSTKKQITENNIQKTNHEIQTNYKKQQSESMNIKSENNSNSFDKNNFPFINNHQISTQVNPYYLQPNNYFNAPPVYYYNPYLPTLSQAPYFSQNNFNVYQPQISLYPQPMLVNPVFQSQEIFQQVPKLQNPQDGQIFLKQQFK